MPAVLLFGAADTVDQFTVNRHSDGFALAGQAVDELFEIFEGKGNHGQSSFLLRHP